MSLDNFSPYSTGMSSKQAVDALWKAYNLDKNYCKIISSSSAPSYSKVDNDSTFWYNETNNKLYRVQRNTTLSIVFWFEV